MEVHIVDTLGGTPYTDWVPKPNFHGPTFTYFDPGPGGIQLLFDIPGWPYTFPTVGSYRASSSRLFCVTNDCVQHFGGNPDVLFAVAGELSLSVVPEPRSVSGSPGAR